MIAPPQRAVPADCLGIRGLPKMRYELDALAHRLCQRLAAAGGAGVTGSRLATELGLTSTRALRLLVAYSRVHHHYHQIVGLPGFGYLWGECAPAVYKTAIRCAERMARCFFFIAALHRRQGAAIAAVQLMFDFLEYNVPEGQRHHDDLAALVASEGVNVTQFLDSFMGSLAETDQGRRVLANVGRRHAAVLVPEAERTAMLKDLDALRDRLARWGRRAG